MSDETTDPVEPKVNILVRRAFRLVEASRQLHKAHEEAKKEKKAYGSASLDDITSELLDLEAAAKAVAGQDAEMRPGYTRTRVEDRPGGSETREYHESFGVIRMGRRQNFGRQGHSRLFGSSLDMHPLTVELEIVRAERLRGDMDNARYWPLGGREHHVVSILLSHHQMAELIMGTDSHSGVPCTLHEVLGASMEPVPSDVRHEHEEIMDDVRDMLKAASDGKGKAHEAVREVHGILEKKHIGKGDRKRITELIGKIATGGRENMGFYMERFNEAAEKVRASVRTDIDATLSHVLKRLGEKTLALRGEAAIDEVRGELTSGAED